MTADVVGWSKGDEGGKEVARGEGEGDESGGVFDPLAFRAKFQTLCITEGLRFLLGLSFSLRLECDECMRLGHRRQQQHFQQNCLSLHSQGDIIFLVWVLESFPRKESKDAIKWTQRLLHV